MSFDALLQELDTLTKAQTTAADGQDDDKNIQAAAGDDDPNKGGSEGGDKPNSDGAGGGDGGGGDPNKDDDDPNKGGDDPNKDDDERLGKSFEVTLENGQKVRAYDGANAVAALEKRMNASEANLEKGFASVLASVNAINQRLDRQGKTQGEVLKSVQAQVERLGGQGQGRKSTLNVSEKRTETELAGQQVQGMGREEFFTKAHAARGAGRVTGEEVMQAEARLNRGIAVSEDVVRRVLAAG